MGRLLRPGQPPVFPNWRQLPVGYHGRTSTIVVSGESVPRPRGLRPTFGPTERLDIEVEVGFVVGTGNPRGRPHSIDEARRAIFGVVLLNDWSARDIQAFEYQPLGPHLGKSFATSISPWVVPLDLVPRVDGQDQDPEPADYLLDAQPRALDLDLALAVNGTVVSKSNARHLYWSPAQMLAHMTVNGASTRPGDLFGSGTVSGPEPGGEGSLAERGGPFLDDGDTVCISSPLLGEVVGRIEP
jgi:fumarylacetoacetase